MCLLRTPTDGTRSAFMREIEQVTSDEAAAVVIRKEERQEVLNYFVLKPSNGEQGPVSADDVVVVAEAKEEGERTPSTPVLAREDLQSSSSNVSEV